MSKINPDYLCPGCMAVLDEPDLPCPLCGFDKNTYAPSQRSLRPFTILSNKYLVGKVIGEGGFGITYIGFNMDTDLPVAIKEYFPAELATRDTMQGNMINVFSGESRDLYKEGLEKYLREARNLTMFSDLPGIVTVKDFFYENETAYIIMEFINGITLKQHLTKVGGRMKQNEVIKMMKPVLESMNKIHEVGIIHRDISPDNIMITRNKQIKLTDFGAARVFDTDDNKSITVVLKRGYAPEEQYRAKGNQGPWTDVYALCATMYRMITGVTPQEALERIIEDNVEPLSKYDSSIWPETEFAIMKGLSLRAQDRYQTVNELIDALYYSVLDTDENGKQFLRITKETSDEQPDVQPVKKESSEEFEIKPIVVSIGKKPEQTTPVEEKPVANENSTSSYTSSFQSAVKPVQSDEENQNTSKLPPFHSALDNEQNFAYSKAEQYAGSAQYNQFVKPHSFTTGEQVQPQYTQTEQNNFEYAGTTKNETYTTEEQPSININNQMEVEKPKVDEPKFEEPKFEEPIQQPEIDKPDKIDIAIHTPIQSEHSSVTNSNANSQYVTRLPEDKKGGFFKSTFKKLVKLQLGKVRFEDNVTDLNVEHMDVGNINVLRECLLLKKLVLNNNMLDDLSPISDCKELEYLALRNTLVSDLSTISKCDKLKYLDLWGTRVTDLHDIYSLSKLNYLNVKNTDIRQSQVDDFKKHNPDCVVEF